MLKLLETKSGFLEADTNIRTLFCSLMRLREVTVNLRVNIHRDTIGVPMESTDRKWEKGRSKC